jgi:2-methylisocitrate lyase-like PEP mutase family enzyme
VNQSERAQLFARLHVKGDPLVLFNVWDAGSAKAVESIGAQALATGSWSVATADGYIDAESIPLDTLLANLRRIVACVTLPVSLDFEGGYARQPADLQANITQVIEAGAIGINFEDQIVGGEGLYSVEEQVTRIAALRQAADQFGVPLFINARTDIFLQAPPEQHSDAHLEAAIRRAHAYAEAGGSGFFAPGLADAARIERLCAASPLPVNIMFLPYAPAPRQLAELGVARISYGPRPYRLVIEALKEAGRKALALE